MKYGTSRQHFVGILVDRPVLIVVTTRMMTNRLFVATTTLLMCLAGTAAADRTGPDKPTAAPQPAPTAKRIPIPLTATANSESCPTGMQAVDAAIAVKGDVISFTLNRGGGCRTKPVYTAAYALAKGKTRAMQVRVCMALDADQCEMYIQDEAVSIDLSAARKSLRAKSIKIVK